MLVHIGAMITITELKKVPNGQLWKEARHFHGKYQFQDCKALGNPNNHVFFLFKQTGC